MGKSQGPQGGPQGGQMGPAQGAQGTQAMRGGQGQPIGETAGRATQGTPQGTEGRAWVTKR